MNQKVILINLPPTPKYKHKNTSVFYPATGILVIGTILKSQGLSVQVIDGALRSNYVERTLESIDNSVVMIGFSVMTSQVPLALNLSMSIKTRFPEIPIVWGGIHPILFPEQTVKNPNIDIVVTGDGFETIMNLIDYINGRISLRQVRGIGFTDTSGEVFISEPSEPDNIDNLPHIDYSILDNIESYLGSKSVVQREITPDNNEVLRVMPILTGLGCCYRCSFCINVILERKYRFKTASSIIGEIKKLQSRYKANTFIFYDEDFLISKKRLYEFLDMIEEENLKFYWRIWTRVNYFRDNYLNRDLILRLERAGLRSAVMGAESGSQEVLNLIKKGIKVEKIIYSAKMLNDTVITPRYSFIVGVDGESKDDTIKTYKLCADLISVNQGVDIAGPYIFRYYPGSPMFDNIIRNYNVKIPQKVEDWDGALSDEGYLKIDKMPWLWPGFIDTVTILNHEMLMFGKLRNRKMFVFKLLKLIIKLRIRNMYTNFPIEIYGYESLKFLYYLFKKIRQ